MAERSLVGLNNMTRRDAILGQLRPANTIAVTIYSPAVDVIGYITWVHICNTTGTATTFRLFIHNTGTTYDETTALEFDKSCPANNSTAISFGQKGLPLIDDTGNFAVRTGIASALTFTVWGYELLGGYI